MKIRSLARPLAALTLTLSLCLVAVADTIHLKDGQVIRGQIVSFRDQQFTVLIGAGARGRRSQVTVYMEDVDSIEFDSAGRADTAAGDNNYTPAPVETSRTQPSPTRQTEPRQTEPRSSSTPPTLGRDGENSSPSSNTSSNTRTNNGTNGAGNATQTAPASGGNSPFFPVRVRVRADNTANGWTDSGLMVRKGQRLRITATGRVSLGQGRFSTPTGLPRVVDTEKLMRNEPTGELIAVVGDDNDEFIAVGASREFYAPRDGRLFLGVNEGNLDDNTGSYDVVVEVEPVTSGGN
jgi:hypothetical protein